MTISLTTNAASRIKNLCHSENAHMVRLEVTGGGCSGFQYVFGFADTPNSDDQVVELEGAKLVVDETSLPFLDGATLDYIDSLTGAHFKIINPNAASSCGCGTSFSVG